MTCSPKTLLPLGNSVNMALLPLCPGRQVLHTVVCQTGSPLCHRERMGLLFLLAKPPDPSRSCDIQMQRTGELRLSVTVGKEPVVEVALV